MFISTRYYKVNVFVWLGSEHEEMIGDNNQREKQKVRRWSIIKSHQRDLVQLYVCVGRYERAYVCARVCRLVSVSACLSVAQRVVLSFVSG